MVDIFDEVEEELRAERAKKLLTNYGGVMIVAALLVVLAVSGWQGWNWWQARQDMAAATRFVAAMGLADSAGTNPTVLHDATTQFQALAANGPAGYQTLARLRVAALQAQQGNLGAANQMWNAVAADSSVDPLLRDLASLMWAEHNLDAGDPGLVASRLKALAEPTNAWHTLAQEQLAILDLRQGKRDAAKKRLRQLAQDITAPNGVRGRAAGLLAQLGG